MFTTALHTTLLKRFVTPAEVANFVVFLSSGQASAITGTAMRVDGGDCPLEFYKNPSIILDSSSFMRSLNCVAWQGMCMRCRKMLSLSDRLMV